MSELFTAFGLDVRLLLIQGLNFGLLLFLLWVFLYKPLLKVLRERERVIAKGLEDAEQAEQVRNEIEKSRSTKIHEAEAEAQEIVTTAKTFAGDEKARLVKEAESRAASIVKDAEAHGEELKSSATKEAEKDIAQLAILAAENILRKKNS